jgi:hypothetical protein
MNTTIKVQKLIDEVQATAQTILNNSHVLHNDITALSSFALEGATKLSGPVYLGNYRPTRHKLQDLVAPELFEAYRANPDVLWQRLDPGMLWTLDAIEKEYGERLYVNTVSESSLVMLGSGGTLKAGMGNRGLRAFGSPVGAHYSLHKLGKAFDFNLSSTSPDKFLGDLVANPTHMIYHYITGIEWKPTIGWTHMDSRNHDKATTNGLPVIFNLAGKRVTYAKP